MPEDCKYVVLVVDDEILARKFATTVLQRAGFLTLSACNATEALTLSRNRADVIDLLIVDVELGDGDGVQLAEQIRMDRKDIGVVVISGRPDNALAAAAKGYPFLLKPFQSVKLVDAVQRIRPTHSPQDEPVRVA